MHVDAYAALDGFALARASTTMQVENALSSNGYIGVASQGARTQVQFQASDLDQVGSVQFNFSLTGTASTPYGQAFPRLDFLARSSPSGSWFDVFGQDALHATATGNHLFTYSGSIVAPLDILFYAAAGVFIGSGFGFADDGADFTAFANFANTFELTDIALFKVSGEEVTDWSMTDEATGRVVFNQDGRIVSSVPEPGTLALLGLAIAGMGLLRARKP